MLDRRMVLLGVSGFAVIAAVQWTRRPSALAETSFEIQKTETEWRRVQAPRSSMCCACTKPNPLGQALSIMKSARERLREGL